MDFDPQTNLEATTRVVVPHDRDGKPAAHVTIFRTFDVAVDDLWGAVTNPDRIPLWFSSVSGDLESGGRFQIENNAGGSIVECEVNSHYSLTWEIWGDVSWVEVRLADEGNGQTRLTLTHTHHISPHWDTYGPGATGVGWEMAFLGLSLYLSDPTFEKPDPEAFALSPEGVAIITGSSNAWADSYIAAGADRSQAEAAARQTTAFYTGQSA